ncbi:MAG: 2-dehydropantoate 2-reductase [Candidatus Omnitrophota bacterium]
MKISVLGAGAIGGLVAGYLKNCGQDVSLVGHPDAVSAISTGGLKISGARGDLNIAIKALPRLVEKPGLAILAVKTQDIDGVLRDNLEYLHDTVLLTTQNGVQADYILSKYISTENIISSIVMFASTYLEPGRIVHNFDRSWIIGRIFPGDAQKLEELKSILSQAFPVATSNNILGMKYLKVFVNSTNCLLAILGVSMQEAFADLDVCKVSIAIWKEGLGIVNKARVRLFSLPDFPVENITKLTNLPSEQSAKIFSGIMTSLSREPLYGSILQSIKRGRPSEIDYINGEFSRLAKECDGAAPLNEKLTGMVHLVEKTGKFFSKEELLREIKGLV